MNKTAIEWCDSTWNPVTGCLHGCEYCYARDMAHRFAGCYDKSSGENIRQNENGVVRLETNENIKYKTKNGNITTAPYPFGFAPTFHRYRLNEYANKKGRTIFVCSMADLFGEWVPDEWITEVFKTCATAPQHIYLFLTKNPDRVYWDDENGNDSVWKSAFDNISNENMKKLHMMFGASVTSDNDSNLEKAYSNLNIDWVSIEPLLGEINEDFFSYTPRNPNSGDDIARWKWVIIGAESGNRKGKVVPKREWIESIVEECRVYDIPVFMKNSLADIWGEPLIQEFPW